MLSQRVFRLLPATRSSHVLQQRLTLSRLYQPSWRSFSRVSLAWRQKNTGLGAPASSSATSQRVSDAQFREKQASDSHNPLIVEIDSASTFQHEVRNHPYGVILLDFYADWCEPCKVFSPLLEKMVDEYKGAVKLLKVNADNLPEIVESFPVEALPTIFAIVHGREVVGQLKGAQSEPALKQFINQMIDIQYKNLSKEQIEELKQAQHQIYHAIGGPGSGDDLGENLTPEKQVELARSYVQQARYELASQIYSRLLSQSGEKKLDKSLQAKAHAGLISCMVPTMDFEGADAIVETLTKNFPKEANDDREVRAAIASVHATKLYVDLPGDSPQEILAALQKEAAKPEKANDPEVKFNLALAQFFLNHHSEAVQHLIDVIKKHKTWNDGAAKKLLLAFFDLLGPENEAVIQGRRKLASALF